MGRVPRRTRLWVCDPDGPATVLSHLEPDVRAARERYLGEYDAICLGVRRAGAVEDGEWLVDPATGLYAERPSWWHFSTAPPPTAEMPLAGMDGYQIGLS